MPKISQKYILLSGLMGFLLAGCTSEYEINYGLIHGCKSKNGACYYELPEGVKIYKKNELDTFIADEKGVKIFQECRKLSKMKSIKVAEAIPPEEETMGWWDWTDHVQICENVYFIIRQGVPPDKDALYGPFNL